MELTGATDPALGARARRRAGRLRRRRGLHPPDTALENALACLRAGVHVVIGTTGFDVDQLRGDCRGANVFVAPNFAIGAVLMMRFAAEASQHMAKAEIIELHHDRKLDAPSGTAARTAELMERRRADPLGAPAGPGGPPGGHPRRRRPDADDPPRLDRPRRRSCPACCSRCAASRPAGLARRRARAPAVIRAATEADAPAIAEIQARAWRWAYSDFLDEDAMPVPSERLERWHGRRRGRARCACSTRTARRRLRRASTGDQLDGPLRRPGRPGRRRRARRCTTTPWRGCAAAGHDARLAVGLRRQRPGPRLLRAPRLAAVGEPVARAALGGAASATSGRCERPRRRHRPRRRALPPAHRRLARRPRRDRRAASRRAWEAGRVSEEPPPGASAARGSVYVRDLTDRALVFVCRRDDARGRGHHALGAAGRRGAAEGRPRSGPTHCAIANAELRSRQASASDPRRRRWPPSPTCSSSPTRRSTRPRCARALVGRAARGPIHATLLVPAAGRSARPPSDGSRRRSRRWSARASRPRASSATPTRSSPCRRRGTRGASTRSWSPRSPRARRAGCRSGCRSASAS